MTIPLDEAQARALLLDVEGTTTSIEFVYRTLFPYARHHLAEFVESHYDTAEFRDNLPQLRQEHEADARRHPDCPTWRDESRQSQIESILKYVQWLMDQDRKSTPLKWLQGKIWESGYRSGALQGHVYPDVSPAFSRWRQKGKRISIFSSGSVLAQKLLFTHTVAGDLTPFIDAYFDTTTGAKTNPESYRKIASALGLSAPTVLFISDNVLELDAAQSAGMSTLLCARPENPPQENPPHDPQEHIVIRSFDEVLPSLP